MTELQAQDWVCVLLDSTDWVTDKISGNLEIPQ